MSKVTPELIEANLGLLDYAIFDHLPDEGTVLGYHPLYKSARQLLHELNEALPDGAPLLKMPELNTRLRSLHLGALVVPVAAKNLTGKTDGWQRSNRAAQLLANYRHEQEPQAPESIIVDPVSDIVDRIDPGVRELFDGEPTGTTKEDS